MHSCVIRREKTAHGDAEDDEDEDEDEEVELPDAPLVISPLRADALDGAVVTATWLSSAPGMIKPRG